MMSRCSNSSHMVGGCTCEMYHPQTSSFSMLFSINNGDHYCTRGFDEDQGMYSSSSSSSVDCTLSLGTPSTRLTINDENMNHHHYHQEHQKRSASKCLSNFGWNILQSKHTPPSSADKNHRAGTNGNPSSGGDPLLARRCANCDTTSTPLWRNGPRGPKSLCNACGIRYKKEERRATSAAAAITTGTTTDNSSWVHSQKMGYYYGNEFRFVEMT